MARASRTGVTRRRFLIGGGVGVGLLVAWAVWPRDYAHNLVAGEDETIVNAFLKIAEDGRVTVIVPQAEMGQGVWTTLPQVLADELGADWRTVGVEPAPINPLYANDFLIAEAADGLLPAFLADAENWATREIGVREAMMITAGSSSIRGFERRFREAGAAARMLLCRAAADRWEVDASECRTGGGFVRHGERSARFGELVGEAAAIELDGPIALRAPDARTISGWSAPRLDLPAKVDGSARFAADVRLPGMIFASSRKAPTPRNRLKSVNRTAADNVFGVISIVENSDFVACSATNWWAAEQGVRALDPRWDSDGPELDDRRIDAALERALAGEGGRFVARGDIGEAFAAGGATSANYAVGLAAHAQLEPLVATARVEGDRLEIWAPTQAPGMMRAAVARATGFNENRVTIYPMLVGGGFGRKLEVDAAVQAAIVAIRMNRPVQLGWSREEESARDTFRPPARARMTARLAPNGQVAAWQARIAAPSVGNRLARRLAPRIATMGIDEGDPDASAISGAEPGYAIPHVAVDHFPVELGLECGVWRSMAHSYTAFFNECFADELAARAGKGPLTFRLAMLGHTPRLANCLSTVATLAGWRDETREAMGIAAHSCFGSHVAMVARVGLDRRRRPFAEKIWAAVDCGRVINAEIVRQQIEGGILFALSAALGPRIGFVDGKPRATNFNGLGLPRLADAPELEIALIENDEAPGGVGEIAVPPVAPAIGNAIHAATGRRLRRLPFDLGESA